jgi:hypothetical protein
MTISFPISANAFYRALVSLRGLHAASVNIYKAALDVSPERWLTISSPRPLEVPRLL